MGCHLFTWCGRACLCPNAQTFVGGPFSSLLSVFESRPLWGFRWLLPRHRCRQPRPKCWQPCCPLCPENYDDWKWLQRRQGEKFSFEPLNLHQTWDSSWIAKFPCIVKSTFISTMTRWLWDNWDPDNWDLDNWDLDNWDLNNWDLDIWGSDNWYSDIWDSDNCY